MSLFGSTNNTQARPSLFTGANQSSSGSLFGQTQPQQQQQQQQQTPQQQSSGSLFGNTQQAQSSGGLFGAAKPAQPAQSSLFASTSQPQQQNNAFGSSLAQQPQALGASQAANTMRSSAQPLWQGSNSLAPREKSVVDQMGTLLKKWSPESPDCCFQKHFYNNVGADRVPYFTPRSDEDEQKWEDALSQKPDANSIPVLCKGFAELGERLRMQVQAVQGLQARLHEINNSLGAQQQQHDLDLSVRAANARRRHITLSQRCLRLATNVQVLRNRGYVLDNTEEELKKKLVQLEKNAFDPALSGRQEEIWARMVGIHERAKILQAESDKINAGLKEDLEGGIDEDILRKTKKILNDYDSQISHLQQEVEAIRKDFADWEGGAASHRRP